ncbi:hypothetical protein HZC00_01325 [Candidatus Kaiserbacteria bacterium]|nr:hypothetical protein [Candidatus Kaiserbacteria bacterium]
MEALKELGRLIIAGTGVVAILVLVVSDIFLTVHLQRGQPVVIDIVFVIASALVLTVVGLLVWKK